MKRYCIPVLLCLLVVSCAPQPTSTPAPLPTNTPPATSTGLPTATEAPTSTHTPPEAPAGTAVRVNPPSQSVNLNELASVGIEVHSVTNLYGMDIRLSFDAAKLEVQDADTAMAGLQLESGSFLDPGHGFVAENSADNTTGTVRYVFTLTSPAPPASGS